MPNGKVYFCMQAYKKYVNTHLRICVNEHGRGPGKRLRNEAVSKCETNEFGYRLRIAALQTMRMRTQT